MRNSKRGKRGAERTGGERKDGRRGKNERGQEDGRSGQGAGRI